MTFVHFGAPLIPDAIRIGARVKSGALGAFLIDGIGSDPTVGFTCFQNGSRCLSGVHVQPISEGDRRLVESLGWSRLEDIWFSGSIGGADIGFGTTEPTLGSQGLYVYSPQGIAFIARLKTPIITEPEIPAQLLCSNDQFVVASRNEVDSSEPKSTRLWIYNRGLQTTSGLLVPGNRNRYRIFGKRLALIISYSGDSPTSGSETGKAIDGSRIVIRSETSGAFDPGEDQQRGDGTSELPPVRSFYHYPAVSQWFPGTLLVIDLVTHETVKYDTAQADSEILDVSDEIVLYRINDQIYSTHLSHGKFGVSNLLVKDDDVPEVHWVFWGPSSSSM